MLAEGAAARAASLTTAAETGGAVASAETAAIEASSRGATVATLTETSTAAAVNAEKAVGLAPAEKAVIAGTTEDATLAAAQSAARGGRPMVKPGLGVAESLALGMIISLAEAGVAQEIYRKGASRLNGLLKLLSENGEVDDDGWHEIAAKLESIQNMKQSWAGTVWEFITYGQGSLTEKKGFAMSMLAAELAKKYGYEEKTTIVDALFGKATEWGKKDE